jgi:BatD DUF11 like domain
VRVLLLLWLLGVPARETPRAFVEMTTDRTTYFVQEPIRLVLHLGIERAFLDKNVMQLSVQRLDVPVQLVARWLDDLPGAVALPPEDPGRDVRQSLALNDGRGLAARVADRTVDGRAFTVLELERRYLPSHAGELVIPEPALRYVYATRFEEDFVNGRRPADQQETLVRGAPLTLRIEPLPDAGRPPEFTGAVGRFTIADQASPRELTVGGSLKLAVTFEGEGNLELFEAPRLSALEHFHVYGKIEETSKARRTITYDLMPLSADVVEVPPIPFAFFDPTPPAGYHGIRTPAIPITVRPGADGTRTVSRPDAATPLVPGENDLFDLKPVGSAAGSTHKLSPALVAIALIAPWLIALGLLQWLRARERERSDPEGRRARDAAREFYARLAEPGADLAEALAEFLAARLRCPTATVIAPELPARLARAGVPRELAERTGALLASLIAARYGGSAPARGSEESRALVDALEATFAAAERVR